MHSSQFKPTPEDDESVIFCRAENPWIHGTQLEAKQKIRVICKSNFFHLLFSSHDHGFYQVLHVSFDPNLGLRNACHCMIVHILVTEPSIKVSVDYLIDQICRSFCCCLANRSVGRLIALHFVAAATSSVECDEGIQRPLRYSSTGDGSIHEM